MNKESTSIIPPNNLQQDSFDLNNSKQPLQRQPRTGKNTRNNSDIVFQFGQNLGYETGTTHPNLDAGRFNYVPVDQSEKQSLKQKREHWNKRAEFKRYNITN
jgi:hypothetical protein